MLFLVQFARSCGTQDYIRENGGEYVERNNLSELKSVFEGMF